MDQEQFLEKYKEFFCNKNFVIECGSGWYNILEDMIAKFRKHRIKIKFNQIKEKYGSLRVYVDFPKSIEDYTKIEKIIHDAENESFKVCEYCGGPSKIKNTNGWYSNICKKCQMLEKLSLNVN